MKRMGVFEVHKKSTQAYANGQSCVHQPDLRPATSKTRGPGATSLTRATIALTLTKAALWSQIQTIWTS